MSPYTNISHRASRDFIFFRFLIAAILCLVPSLSRTRAETSTGPEALTVASAILKHTQIPGGIVVCVGDDAATARLAEAIADSGPFTVQLLVRDATRCAVLRETLAKRGVYGPLTVDVLSQSSLPYVDNLINLVVVDGAAAAQLELKEVRRALAPLGWIAAPAGVLDRNALSAAGFESIGQVEAAGARWTVARKPWPNDVDEWTHYVHGPDGNPVARDLRVGPPRHYQWIANPLWLRSHETDSSVRTLVTARGRILSIEDEAPISLAGKNNLPDDWVLKCRDAFNGVEVWKIPIRQWGWREWKSSWFTPRPGDIPLNIEKRLVAVGDDVYVTLGYKAPVSRIDARTGAVLQTYPRTNPTGEILFCKGKLLVSRFKRDGVEVMLVDPDSGKTIWTTPEVYRGTTVDYYRWWAMHGRIKPAPLDPTLNLAADGETVALLDYDAVVGLDFTTGRRKWRTRFPIAPEDRRAGNIRADDRAWLGAMIVKDGVVLCASPSRLAAFDADTGKILWTKPKRYIGHLWYEWKEVFVIDGLVWTWTDKLERFRYKHRGRTSGTQFPPTLNGYDLHTGELKRTVPTGPIYKTYHHHRCYRDKATVKYVITSRRGTECVDLAGGVHTVDNWVRGTCHVGMMPANGLLYVPPHPCQCYIQEKIKGFNALSAGPPVPKDLPPAPKLVRGPAWGAIGQSAPAGPDDWPTFRHDGERSGAVPTRLPHSLRPIWRTHVGRGVTPPIAVGDDIFVALRDQDSVICLDARTGSIRWRFIAGGPIDSPPTWRRGALYFGCHDGWVYCLRAADGALVWKFRAAPADRRMAAFERIESLWPVHGSVLVANGLVYCSAGRSSEIDGGIYAFALDPITGKVVHSRNLHGPFYNSENIRNNYQLPMGSLNDVLMTDGNLIWMQLTGLDAALNPVPKSPPEQIPGGFLDDSYFKRVPWRMGKEHGRLFVKSRNTVYFVRMFDTLRGLDPTVYFVPGRQGYLLFAKNLQENKRPWMERVRIRIRAMVLCENALAVAGPPDITDSLDPLGAFRGRKGGVLCILDRKSGKQIAEIQEPSPPVFNGIAAARERLILCERDGSVACFGSSSNSQPVGAEK